MALNITFNSASAADGEVPALPANPPVIIGAAGQVNNTLTLSNGTVVN